MPRPEKVQMVNAFAEKLGRSKSLVVTTYMGLDAQQMAALRRQMKAAGIEFRVVKNTLFGRALQQAGFNGELLQRLRGPLAVAIGYDDPVSAPKVVHQLRKDYEALSLLWGIVEGRVYDGPQLEAIATLPPREQLIADLLGALLAPLSALVGIVDTLLWELTAVLEAVMQKHSGHEGGSPMAATTKVQELVDAIKGMSLLELKQLVDALKDEFGITGVAPVAVAAPGAAAPAAAEAPAAEEKTEFKVVLKSAGEQKLQVIKAVREVVPGLGLKEAKDLVESAPSVLRESVSKEEAQQIKAKLEAVGAVVEIE